MLDRLRSRPIGGRLLVITAAAAVLATITLCVGEMVRSGLTDSLTAAEPQPSPASAAKAPDPPTSAPSPSAFPSDNRGFLDSNARCGPSQTAAVAARTPRSLLVICSGPAGRYQYRGVRLSDGAVLTAPAATAPDGGYFAENEGVRYALSPEELLITAGDDVIRREPVLAYRQVDSVPAEVAPPQVISPSPVGAPQPMG